MLTLAQVDITVAVFSTQEIMHFHDLDFLHLLICMVYSYDTSYLSVLSSYTHSTLTHSRQVTTAKTNINNQYVKPDMS